MRRSLYISLFMLLALAFVPVPFFYGFGFYVVPVGYMALKTINGFSEWVTELLTLAHLFVYSLLFYVTARITFWVSGTSPLHTIPLAVQIVFLVSVFSCSFIPAITYGGIWQQGGTYTFWGAVQRYFEKPHDL